MTPVPTSVYRVYMAGDIETAKRWLRQECWRSPLCVTVEPTTFIYTGGEETGFVVGLLDYPRFPDRHGTLADRAREIKPSPGWCPANRVGGHALSGPPPSPPHPCFAASHRP